MEELGIPVLQADSEMVAGLTEATISCALRRLRGAARGLSPLEVARLRCVFEIRSFAAGQAVAEQGALQEGMYFIQSGTAFCVKTAAGDVEPEVGHGAGSGSGANLKGGAGRAETVVMTLAPGQVFGLEALTGEGRARWPWHVRCAAPLVALFVPAETFERMVRQLVLRGASPLTDGLANVLEMMREACLILSEVYDIRLQLRNRRLLQEYHFDVQVSGRRYRAAPRAAEAEAETDELRSFPLATLRRGPVEFKTRFRVRGVQVCTPISPAWRV
jgi:CRP-like cAMP-binding protein